MSSRWNQGRLLTGVDMVEVETKAELGVVPKVWRATVELLASVTEVETVE